MVFRLANDSYNAVLTSDYTVGDAVINVNNIPVNTPTIVTVARGTDKETRFYVTGTAAGQLTGCTWKEGAAVNIPAGVSVECMIDDDFVNQLGSAVFNQAGLKGLTYAADGGSSDAYAITLPVPPAALTDIIGVPISFKANTANTGAATLDVNSLGSIAIKKLTNQALDDNNILAAQAVLVVYDGTVFQMLGDVPVTKVKITSAASYTTDTGTSLNCDTTDQFVITAQAGALLFNNPSGTPVQGQKLIIRIKDNATARALTYDTQFRA